MFTKISPKWRIMAIIFLDWSGAVCKRLPCGVVVLEGGTEGMESSEDVGIVEVDSIDGFIFPSWYYNKTSDMVAVFCITWSLATCEYHRFFKLSADFIILDYMSYKFHINLSFCYLLLWIWIYFLCPTLAFKDPRDPLCFRPLCRNLPGPRHRFLGLC